MGEADKLPDVLDDAGVTVLDTVPTLLAMLPKDMPRLRIIILGGEACPPSVAARWCRPGRKIFNSYGPTEATVVATVAEVLRDEPVTIGGPIPNYTCYVADEALNLLDRGVEGELLIGGPGVARGYLKRDELTAREIRRQSVRLGRSRSDPLPLGRCRRARRRRQHRLSRPHRRPGEDPRLPRRARRDRGAARRSCPALRRPPSCVRTETASTSSSRFSSPNAAPTSIRSDLRAELREHLPAYMVPARYETLDDAAAPAVRQGRPQGAEGAAARAGRRRSTSRRSRAPRPKPLLLAAAQKALPPQAIPFDADFFTDLGGHSLVAARFVSVVRETPRLAGVTLQDVYKHRTLRAIGAHLDGREIASGPPRDLSFTPVPLLRRFLCGLAQAAVLPFIFALMTSQWLGVFVSYMLITGPDATLARRDDRAARRLHVHQPRDGRRSRSAANGCCSGAPSPAAIRCGARTITAGGWRSA